MDHQLEIWHRNLLSDFSELGICYREDAIAINPLELPGGLIHQLVIELPQIAELARTVVLKNIEQSLSYAREDYVELIRLYKNKPRAPIVMRPDSILVNGQLKLIEINMDSSIGGIWEMDFLQSRIRNNPLMSSYNDPIFPNPKEMFLKFLQDVRVNANLPTDSNLALVGYADYNQFYIDQGHDICHWITKDTGFNAFFKTPESLRCEREWVTDGIRDYHVLYRDGALVHSYKKTQPMIKLLKDTYRTNTLVLSDPIDLLIEHKGILAIFNELLINKNDKIELTVFEQKLLEKYIPWTTFIQDQEVNYFGQVSSVKQLLMDKQDAFVIKRCCSHAGEHVFMGSELNQVQWMDLVDKAMQGYDGKWVAQENLSSEPYNFKYHAAGQGTYEKQQKFTLSPFIFGNYFGGLLVRIEQNKKKRVLALPTNSDISSAGIIIV